MTTMQGRKLALLAAMVAAAGGMVAGCSPGHGKYTGEFKDQAILRMNTMKAATSWDLAQQQFLSGDLKKALKIPKAGVVHSFNQ